MRLDGGEGVEKGGKYMSVVSGRGLNTTTDMGVDELAMWCMWTWACKNVMDSLLI